MAKKDPTRFTADDGKTFGTLAEAEQHELIVNAVNDYKAARDKYEHIICQTQKTADGQGFRLGMASTYYVIRTSAFGRPTINRLSLSYYQCRLNDEDHAVIIEETTRNNAPALIHHTISTLYYSERAAKVELLERLKQYQIWLNSDVDDLIKEVGR